MPRHKNRDQGFTLIELLVTIAVAAILISLAVPSLTQVINNNRISAQNNDLIALISLAKSQAVRRNANYTVDLISTSDNWSAFVNREVPAPTPAPGEEPPDPTCEVSAIRCAEHERVSLGIDEAGAPLVFDQRGYLEGLEPRTITLQHEPCSGSRQRRVISITGTGQISSETAECQ